MICISYMVYILRPMVNLVLLKDVLAMNVATGRMAIHVLYLITGEL